MLTDLQFQQNVFQRRCKLARAQQQRGGLPGEGIDDFGAIGQREPVMKCDM